MKYVLTSVLLLVPFVASAQNNPPGVVVEPDGTVIPCDVVKACPSGDPQPKTQLVIPRRSPLPM